MQIMKLTAYLVLLVYWANGKPVLEDDSDSAWEYGKPIFGDGGNPLEINSGVIDFLKERGWLDVKHGNAQLMGIESLGKSLRGFQKFVGIPETGTVDPDTLEWMHKDRCGRPDVEIEPLLRRKRYVKQGTRWSRSLMPLTWNLENSNNDGITNDQVRHVFRNSLEKWRAVTNLEFYEENDVPDDSVDIRVRFGKDMKHEGCPYPFDGKGGTLAHAFYPLGNTGLAGDVHYDDHEDFTIQADAPHGKIKLFWTTVHELGHTLGLAHSNKRGAIMYPYYQHVGGDDFDLTDDDVKGIQSLYGVRKVQTKSTPEPPPPTPPVPPEDQCADLFTAAYIDDARSFHVFNKDKHYVLDNEVGGVKYGPSTVSSHFKGLQTVDTVFQRHNDRFLVVFYGDKFTIYNGKEVYEGERRIVDGFQNLQQDVDSIDAAIIWPEDNRLYLFKGEQYWRMVQMANLDYIAEFGYPQKITANWHGLPERIDSAFIWENQRIYFTRGDLYYRWNDRQREVHSGYPQKMSRSFLRCPRPAQNNEGVFK